MKRVAALVFSFLFIHCAAQNNSQGTVIDSMKAILHAAKEDTNKVKTLNNLSWELKQNNLDTAIAVCRQALKLAEQLKWQKGIASSHRKLGVFNWLKGDYSGALQCYFDALKINEAQDDKSGMFASYQNIAIIYNDLKQPKKSMHYYKMALMLAEKMKDKSRVGLTLGNIAGLYQSQKQFDTALVFYEKALAIEEELGNKNEIAREIGNIGNVYSAQNKHAKALEYAFRALKMFEELGDEWSVTLNQGNIGIIYGKMKNHRESEKYFYKALTFAVKMNALDYIKQYESQLSELYEETGQPALALLHYKKHIAARDSLYNEENLRNETQTEMNFEFDKKQSLLKVENEKQAAVAEESLKRERLRRNYLIAGFIVVLIFSLFILKAYRQKRKAHHIISEQKKQVENKNQIIEEKQKEIVSSINYAKRIQKALLPSDRYMNKNIERLKNKN